MYKIVRCEGKSREVIDSFDTYENARDMRREYQLSDSSARYLLRFPPKSEHHRAEEWHAIAARHDDY